MKAVKKIGKKETNPGKNGPLKEIERGTNDDLEILYQIVRSTPAIRTQVMIRLREAKARALKGS